MDITKIEAFEYNGPNGMELFLVANTQEGQDVVFEVMLWERAAIYSTLTPTCMALLANDFSSLTKVLKKTTMVQSAKWERMATVSADQTVIREDDPMKYYSRDIFWWIMDRPDKLKGGPLRMLTRSR